MYIYRERYVKTLLYLYSYIVTISYMSIVIYLRDLVFKRGFGLVICRHSCRSIATFLKVYGETPRPLRI